MMKKRKNLRNFLADETGFVSRDKLLVSGLMCTFFVFGLEEDSTASSAHLNVSNYHANWVTNDDSCSTWVHHINENRHLSHNSS